MVQPVHPSVCHAFFTMFASLVSSWNFTTHRNYVEFTDGYENMHNRAWSYVEQVPYCFSRSSVKFQGHIYAEKLTILIQTEHFRTVASVWIDRWLGTVHKTWRGREEVPCCFSRLSIKFQCHTAHKVDDFDPNWALPDCNSSMNSQMAMKWFTNLELA